MPVTGGLRAAFDRTRPGVGMKLAAGKIDLAQFTAPAAEGAPADEALDLSALGLLDANVDFTAEEIVSGEMALRNLGLDVKLAGSVLEAGVRSVEINGAPGSGTIVIDARNAEPTVSGTVKMSGLDLAGLMALAGQTAPVTGTVGLDVKFTTHGATSAALAANLEAGGAVSLERWACHRPRRRRPRRRRQGGGHARGHRHHGDLRLARFAGGCRRQRHLARHALSPSPPRPTAARSSPARTSASPSTPLPTASSSASTAAPASPGWASGKISLSTGSLRDLLAWIGQPLEAGRGLKAFSIEGNVKLAADSFSFENANFTLDKSSGVGTGKLSFGGKPTLTAGLAMKMLDVSPYLAPPKGGGGDGGDGGGGGGGGGGADTPVDFSGLKAMDANLNLKADAILANAIKIGPSALTVKIANGRLDANLTEMALYSGAGTGAIADRRRVGDAGDRRELPARRASMRSPSSPTCLASSGSRGREASPSTSRRAARARRRSPGRSPATGSMAVKNGAIRGVNIPKMLQSLSVQTLMGWQPSNDKTEFSRRRRHLHHRQGHRHQQ